MGVRFITRSKSSSVSGTLSLARDRQQVQHGVGRAAGRRDAAIAFSSDCARDDVARADVALAADP